MLDPVSEDSGRNEERAVLVIYYDQAGRRSLGNRQQCHKLRMARQFHLGGHFGWANRVFVAEVVAPLLSDM